CSPHTAGSASRRHCSKHWNRLLPKPAIRGSIWIPRPEWTRPCAFTSATTMTLALGTTTTRKLRFSYVKESPKRVITDDRQSPAGYERSLQAWFPRKRKLACQY